MSGGLIVSRDLELLAPKFRIAVQAAVAECRAAGLDAWVFEAYRSQELQALYYARGRTVIPPPRTVTNAPTNLLSWHGYGLAIDVVSEKHFWGARYRAALIFRFSASVQSSTRL
jgi:peptidoglycan L-alanyl-D-glutamate endopeptidase CwlK